MNDWRQRLQDLHATVRAARLAEERARDAYRLAQAGRKEAERRLTAWIEAEAEPCPLFDGVAAQAEPAVQARPEQSMPVVPAPRQPAVEPEATAAPTKKPRKRKPKQAGKAQSDQADPDQGDRPEVQTWDVYHTCGRDAPLGQVEARTWERAHALAAQAWEGKTVLVVGVGEPCPQERYAGWVHPDWCRPVEIEISHFPHHNLRTVWDPDARQPLVAHLPDGRAIPLDPTGWQHLPLGHAATQLLGEALREEAPR